MIEAQLVTGATHDRRIFTGSAACAAPALKSAAAATLANTNFERRMGIPPADCFSRLCAIYAQRGRAAAVLANAQLAHPSLDRGLLPRQGEASSRTPPLGSPPKAPVIAAAPAATIANVTKTDGRPPASIIPTTVGPIIDANRSQAVAAPTPRARTRVG